MGPEQVTGYVIMIRTMTSLMITFSMLIIISGPVLSFEEVQAYEKRREERFWRKLDSQIEMFKKSVEELEKVDDKTLEKRIRQLSEKSHHIMDSVTPEEIKNKIPYYKSEQFVLDIKDKVNQEISKYDNFNHFYEQTMSGGNRALCMMGKIGIWTTAPVVIPGSLVVSFGFMLAAAYAEPEIGPIIVFGVFLDKAFDYLSIFTKRGYRCFAQR